MPPGCFRQKVIQIKILFENMIKCVVSLPHLYVIISNFLGELRNVPKHTLRGPNASHLLFKEAYYKERISVFGQKLTINLSQNISQKLILTLWNIVEKTRHKDDFKKAPANVEKLISTLGDKVC